MPLNLQTSAIYGALFGDEDIAAALSDEAYVAAMIRFEAALARAEAAVGVIPTEAGDALAAAIDGVSVPPADLAAGAASAGVPVPALVAALRKGVAPDLGQWLHWGATSHDVVDAAQILMLKDCLGIMVPRIAAVIDGLQSLSETHAEIIMAGRTRSQVAAPTTFGLRCATWAKPFIARERELPQLRSSALVVQFGGAVGANTVVHPHGPAIIDVMAAELGLTPAPAWHVDRSNLTALSHWMVMLAQAAAKLAGDLMLMGRSEIAEARAGQGGGSSTMPNKANPVTAEAVLTLATMAQTAHAGLLASATQAEERHGPPWAAEWALLPQVALATGAALRHSQTLVETLSADPDAMRRHLEAQDGVMAEAASFALAAHMPRAEAQALVKKAIAMEPTLLEGLKAVSDAPVDWDAVLDPASAVPSCQAAAAAIFERR